MHLYCMRHGEACRTEFDPDQPLTPQGELDVMAIADFLYVESIQIEHIIHSSKLRSKQTAKLIADKLSIQHLSESPNLLAEDSKIEDLVNMIRDWQEETLLVGHLPMIDNLVQFLAVGHLEQHRIINFQPGTIVRLKSCHNNHWLMDWILHPYMCS